MNLSIYYQNVRGLRSKLSDFYNAISAENYDVIICTETWLNNSVTDCEVFDGRYRVFRVDRDCVRANKLDGGGVLIAVNKKYRAELCALQLNLYLETVGIFVYFPNNKRYFINTVYFPPEARLPVYRQYFDCLEASVNLLDTNVIIAGDFNIPEITGSNYNLLNGSCLSRQLNDTLAFLGLESRNNISNCNQCTLDLVVCDKLSRTTVTREASVVPEDRHHPSLLITIEIPSLSFPKPSDPNILNFKYNFRKGNYLSLYNSLYNTNWNYIKQYNEVNEALNFFLC
jgi:hypothetical protein